MLKPLDIVIAVSLATLEAPARETFAGLAAMFETSSATIHRGVGRLIDAELLRRTRRSSRSPGDYRVDLLGLTEVVTHGLRYFMPARLGAPGQGMPTAHSGPDLAERIRSETPTVWPDLDGEAFGPTVEPLHHAVPRVARLQPQFYRAMALADAARIGRARERALVGKLLPLVLSEGTDDDR